MKLIRYSLVLLICAFIFNTKIYSQGYEITVKMKQLSGKTLILGHRLGETKTLGLDDTVKLDQKGIGLFKKKTTLPIGFYVIILPDRKYFDFIIDKEKKFTIENDTIDLFANMKITGSAVGTYFADFQRKRISLNKKAEELQGERKTNANNPEKVKAIDENLKKLSEDYKSLFEKAKQENPNTFFSKFLKSLEEVQIPASITKDIEKYHYFRNHYFDNFDISDSSLLRTPFYWEKIENYIDKWVSPHPDSLIKEVDFLVSKSRRSRELFRFMVTTLFNKYATSQLVKDENVYVHISEKFMIPEADWIKKDFINELKEKVRRKNKCLLGNQALDIKLQTLFGDTFQIMSLRDELTDLKANVLKIEKDTITMTKDQRINAKILILNEYMSHFKGYISSNKVNARYTILWFWEPDCSHCKEETPKFHKIYQEKLKNKGVEVIAIYLQRNIDEWARFTDHIKHWLDFTISNKLTDWVNAWNPYDPFRDNFDISTTPVLYLLDKDKKIVAKRIGYEQVLEVIDNLEKDEKETNIKK